MAFNSANQNNHGNNMMNIQKNSMQDLLSKLPKASKHEYESLFVQIFEILDEGKDKSSEKHIKEGYIEKLVDLYLQTFSERVFKVLVAISSPLDECLFNILMRKISNIQSCLEKRFAVFILISNIVHRSPTWLPNIINQTLLNRFFSILMNEQEIVILAITALILVELTATLPCLMSQCLDDIFTCFARLSTFLYKGMILNDKKNPNEKKNLSMLHLNSIVYRVFIRLYAMYPCNFLNFLKTTYGMGCNIKENIAVFHRIIEPMLNKIRFHPLLITASKDKECDKSRWFYKEAHDILEECGQFSIDPIESSCLDDEVFQLYDFFASNDSEEIAADSQDPFYMTYEESSNAIFSELAKEINEKDKTSSLSLLKNLISTNEDGNNLESAEEAIMLSKDMLKSVQTNLENFSAKNLVKPVAIPANSKDSLMPVQKKNITIAANNNNNNNNNKKQCFSPFKPIKEIGNGNNTGFNQPEHDLASKATSPIDNQVLFQNRNHSSNAEPFNSSGNSNENEEVDMEIISYNLESKTNNHNNNNNDKNNINRIHQSSQADKNNDFELITSSEKIDDHHHHHPNNNDGDNKCGKMPDELIQNIRTSFKQINTRIRYQSNCLPETEKGENGGYCCSNGFPISMQNLQQTFSHSCPMLYFSNDSEDSLEFIKENKQDWNKNGRKDDSAIGKRQRVNLILDDPNAESRRTSQSIGQKTCKSVDFTKETKARLALNKISTCTDHTKNAYFNKLFSLLDSKRQLFPSSSSIDFQTQQKLEISSPHELLNRTLSTLSDVYLKDCSDRNLNINEPEDHSNQTSRRDSVFNTNSSASSIEHIPSLNYLNCNSNEEDMRKILAVMYAQLVFERHQRDLHVIRNRRLYKKSKESIQLEAKYLTLVEKLKFQNEEKENLRLILLRNAKELEHERKCFVQQILGLQEELDKCKYDFETLQNEKIGLELHYKQEIEALNKNFRTKELELNKYICNFNKNVDLLKLEKENLELKNQIFLFGEFCGKIRDAYCLNKCTPDMNDKLMFDSLKYENEDLKNKNERLESQLQLYMEKCRDLENLVKQEETKNKNKVSSDEIEYFRECLKVKDNQINVMKTMLVNYEAHIQKLNGELSTKDAQI